MIHSNCISRTTIPGFLQPELVEIEEIEKRAQAIGDTNRLWNVYKAVLSQCKIYETHGLTPRVIQDQLTGAMIITTEEFQLGRFH